MGLRAWEPAGRRIGKHQKRLSDRLLQTLRQRYNENIRRKRFPPSSAFSPTRKNGAAGILFRQRRAHTGETSYGNAPVPSLKFARHAAKTLSWVDETRLGVTGGSYGGIMTNWIIGHTDLFKAAISDRSSANNISDFGMSDIGVSFALDTYETTPWGNLEFLWDASPLKYAP